MLEGALHFQLELVRRRLQVVALGVVAQPHCNVVHWARCSAALMVFLEINVANFYGPNTN